MGQAQAERSDPRKSSVEVTQPSPAPAVEKASDRSDPAPRRDRMLPGTVLNKRGDREYVYANPNDQLFGLSRHLDDGWMPVKTSDVERVYAGSRQPDGNWTFQGQVLLWIDKAKHQADLDAAQEILRARENKARAPGGVDSVVGVDGRTAEHWRG